jgi:hypothetical protein
MRAVQSLNRPARNTTVSNRSVAVICSSLLALAPFSLSAGALRTDQRAAIENILDTVEPSMREMVRAQLEQAIVHLTPEQVEVFVTRAAEQAEAGSTAEQSPPKQVRKREATPADLAHNRAQYEPAIRRHWEARKAFDDFVGAELETKCPDRHKYAVYREAERYELMALDPEWQRASWNADTDIQVWGARVPQDGRYDFDFSKVRMTFDKQAVASAVSKACADWTKEAIVFQEEASALMHAGQSGAAQRLENGSASGVTEIRESLNEVLERESPGTDYNSALMNALQNPKPVT